MFSTKTAKRLALAHLVLSIMLLYFLVALQLPGRAEPSMVSVVAGAIWGSLNVPLYLLREAFTHLTGQPLAFFSVLALQVLFSYGVYVLLLWIIDRTSNRTSNRTSPKAASDAQ
ncbi:MAG: hypothetical protein EAZ92_03210 [Candidatus Kapaibacterium sp.]|nr:MAG: hypothetical protein EAZ92_03210 [Candidatus Kapabacteria bacterium]